MIRSRIISRAAAVALSIALAVTTLVVPVGSAAAEGLGAVPNHAIVGSIDLFGMEEAEARAVISREASVTLLPRLAVTTLGRTYSLEASRALALDVEAMLAAAYAPSSEPSFVVPRSVVVSSAVVTSFVSGIAKSVYRPSRNAYYYVRNGRLLWRPAIYARTLQSASAVASITAALRGEAVSGSLQPTVTAPCKWTPPAVTDAKLGRAILVDLSLRQLWLYDHSRVVRAFRVAIGMRAYPTPTGTFKVTWKKMNPSWGNPGTDWARNMPAYIPPGPTNPLGTRALYLSAPGIRIHGTSQWWSIGHAASHGCIRLTNPSVEALYPLVPIGTRVFIIP